MIGCKPLEVAVLNVAIVGVGWAGTRHVEGIRELGEKIRVDCLVDRDAEHLDVLANELGVDKTYGDLAEALRDEAVDAVSIATPHAAHCEQAVLAAEAGKHVMVEKPMALTVEEATRMVDAADGAGVKLYVAESAVYTPMSAFLREMVQTGKYIGEVVAASFSGGFRGPDYGYPGRRAWLANLEMGGTGTWMLHGIHSMAQLRYVLGEVETVYLQQHRAASFRRTDVEGTMHGLLTMVDGFQVSVLQTCEVRFRGPLGGFEIHGDRGSVKASSEGCQVFGEEVEEDVLHLDYPEFDLSSFALEMKAFADYVIDDVEGPTSGVCERRSLAVVQAGYESAESGAPVHLETRFGVL